MLGHEVAVEQPQDGLLGDPLGEVEFVFLERLALGAGGRGRSAAARPPAGGGDFLADERDQHIEHGTLLAGRLIEHFLVDFRDMVELQLRQVGEEFVVVWGCHVGGSSGLESESP